jgi:diacylglycerol kinase family enzyme
MPQPRPQHWLINPRSGNGAGERLRLALQGTADVTTEAIRFDSLSEQLNAIPPEALLVVAGGDGTFSSVFGMSEARDREVACVPLGTANDLAREFSTSRLLRGARYTDYPSILDRLPFRRCAVWSVRIDGREVPFINYVSIGYEGAVVRDFAAWRSSTRFRGRMANRVAYTFFGLRHALVRLRDLTVRNDQESPRLCPPTTGVIITNIKSHLGMALCNTESDPSDDIIEAVSVSNVLGFPRMMLAGLGVPVGLSPMTRGKRIAIENIPQGTPLQIDGETSPNIQGGELVVTFKHLVRIASAV